MAAILLQEEYEHTPSVKKEKDISFESIYSSMDQWKWIINHEGRINIL